MSYLRKFYYPRAYFFELNNKPAWVIGRGKNLRSPLNGFFVITIRIHLLYAINENSSN